MLGKRGYRLGQVTIFIIIAIIIVASVVLFFVFRNKAGETPEPSISSDPVYNFFLSCLEEESLTGISVLESQGGYMENPEFEPGSRHMPFSSQLDFLGNPVPYWYYVSANNIQKEQVPTKSGMEEQIANYIESKARNCDFSSYNDQGYEVIQGEPKASAAIKDNEVEINVNMDFTINKGTDSSSFKSHKIVVQSSLGELYDSALKVYDKEQSEMFLENYGVDSLRLYAPVEGVELSCSPLVWNADDVFDDIQEAVEANTLALNVKNDAYFKVSVDGVGLDTQIKFLNSRNWVYSYEVNPSDGPVLMSNPVGNQPGFGILGFCYVPYHFVYDIKYPVLVQLQKGEEIFQFPVAVVIMGNKPREALSGSSSGFEVPDICENKNTKAKINVYDNSLRKVDAEIFYECLGTKCLIGETTNGILDGKLPQCVNGFVIARADGYRETRELYSSVQEGQVEIIMDKTYTKNVDLKLDGKIYSGSAIIYFVSDKDTKTVVYPGQKTVELGEEQYEIQVYIYKNSSIDIGESVSSQCTDVPRGGVLGIIGLTKKKCFDIKIPAQIISNALVGGGKESYYVLDDELSGSGSIEINAGSLAVPKTIEDLQNNYILFETKGLDVEFK
jgi:hypothetical protein